MFGTYHYWFAAVVVVVLELEVEVEAVQHNFVVVVAVLAVGSCSVDELVHHMLDDCCHNRHCYFYKYYDCRLVGYGYFGVHQHFG